MDAPAVAVREGKVAVAWMDMRAGRGDRDVQWAIGTLAGLKAEERVHAVGTGAQGHPALLFDEAGTLWCAWEDSRDGTARIRLRNTQDDADVLASTPEETKCGFPSLATGDGLVVLAYETDGQIVVRVLRG